MVGWVVGVNNKTNTQRSAANLRPVVYTRRARARVGGGRAAEKRRSENVCESSSRKKHTTQDDEGVEDERVS